jgi:hypothetical protein
VRSKSFRSDTLATRAGEHIFVPALPQDTMGSLFDQLREADGTLHVAVVHGKDLLIFAMVEHKRARHAGPQADPADYFPMGPDMRVGIVLDYLILRNRPIIVQEASPQVSLELVENPSDENEPKPTPCDPQAARR